VGQYEKQGRVKVGWVFFIEFYLAFEIIPRIIKCVDFIHPEGSLIKCMQSQSKPDDETKDEDDDFFSVYFLHILKIGLPKGGSEKHRKLKSTSATFEPKNPGCNFTLLFNTKTSFIKLLSIYHTE